MISTQHIRELRTELRAAGVFEHQEGRTWLELLLLLSVFGAATALTAVYGLPLAFLTVPLAAFSLTSAVMLGHEGGHGALSSSRFRNELMLHLTFPLIGGMSARYWKHKHNVLHHGHPNVPDHDEDLQLWPMAATRAHHDASPAPLRWFQKHLQGFAFWPLTSFLTWTIRASSVTHLIRDGQRGRRGGWYWLDVAMFVMHHVVWLVIPSFFFDLGSVFAFYLALWALISVSLSAIFVPAHIGLPVVDACDNGWLLQLQTTRNLAMPRALGWFFMGLDRQVEHHLFPRLPHRNLPRAAAIVEAWANRIGAPYQTINYASGLAQVTRHMFRAWDDPATTITSGVPLAMPVSESPDSGRAPQAA